MQLAVSVFLGGLFLVLLGVNFYFKKQILTSYKYLYRNQVAFEFRHIKDVDLLEKEVITKYPQHADEIRRFVFGIRRAFSYILGLLLLLLVLAWAVYKCYA